MAKEPVRVIEQLTDTFRWQGEALSTHGSGMGAPADTDALIIWLDQPAAVRQVVEREVVPRVRRTLTDPAIADAAVDQLVVLLLDHSSDETLFEQCRLRFARHATIEDVCLRLFQPAARRIGDLWTDDRCSFVDVTLAVGALQRLMRRITPPLPERGFGRHGRRALLATLPGEQHTFGVTMLAGMFGRAGWEVCGAGDEAECRDLGEAVAESWFAVVGLSVGGETRLDDLAAAVRVVRERSCNPAVGVLVGGPLFVGRMDYVAAVGADAGGEDPFLALAWADAIAARAASS